MERFQKNTTAEAFFKEKSFILLEMTPSCEINWANLINKTLCILLLRKVKNKNLHYVTQKYYPKQVCVKGKNKAGIPEEKPQ